MMHWQTARVRLMNKKLLIYFISFSLWVWALFISINPRTNNTAEIRFVLTGSTDAYLQRLEKTPEEEKRQGEERSRGMMRWRRRRVLSEPGSWPPRCTSKCGACTPCRPVHVAVPPGTPVTAEYYPEAWRCKCGNRLYMP